MTGVLYDFAEGYVEGYVSTSRELWAPSHLKKGFDPWHRYSDPYVRGVIAGMVAVAYGIDLSSVIQ